ncbi:SDR family oxidoreductase [Dehalobacter sp. DCM]|uniref:SDR family NAD(P)-dependent oxidoreductase n=1 Tax=Dehalobacter sp. DCM TaxID=2907827 RepID=UPI0030820D84|nr:SDR family oxidoreductase [Dehalobacter sp. DCM]
MITSMENAFSLKGKTALITGGNRGIGRGIATAMAQCGADIAIMARDEEAGKKVLEELAAYGGNHRFYQGTVTDPAQAKSVVEAVFEDYRKIDILVNNSGIFRWFNVLEMDPNDLRDWYDVIDVNLNGVFIMAMLVSQKMKLTGGGSIINISSNAAHIVNIPQNTCSYSSAKAAVDHLTRCLAVEFGPHKIRVNSICPGFVEADNPPDDPEMKAIVDMWISRCPTGRFTYPLELGALAVFLASDASENMTGSINTMDSGYELSR